EKIIVDEKTITIKLRRGPLLGGDVPSSTSEAASDSAVELTAAVAFTRRGAETKLVLPGLAQQNHSWRCDPALIRAIARGRAWFEELATGRARSRPRASAVNVRTFRRWDCINARQRERAKEARFAACTSLLTSRASRRMPPKCGAFRFQPRGSPLRQTGCWREQDSNHRSPA